MIKVIVNNVSAFKRISIFSHSLSQNVTLQGVKIFVLFGPNYSWIPNNIRTWKFTNTEYRILFVTSKSTNTEYRIVLFGPNYSNNQIIELFVATLQEIHLPSSPCLPIPCVWRCPAPLQLLTSETEVRVSSYCARVIVSSAWVTVIRPVGGYFVDIMWREYGISGSSKLATSIWHMCGVLFWGILFKRLEIFDFVYFFGLFHDIFNFGHHHIINQGATNFKQTFSFPAGRNR